MDTNTTSGAVRADGPRLDTVTRPLSPTIEDDIELSRKIQLSMVPQSLPAVQGLDVATLFLPCGGVGGDLYDIVQISNDVLAFFVFDVAGHGVSSALISAMAKVSFSNHIRSVSAPHTVLERVNKELKRNLPTNFFVTAFVGFLDLHNNRLTFSNAGHPYPLVFRRDVKSIEPLRTPGLFLGVFDDGQFADSNIYLSPGDWLVLYTDGLYSLFDAEDEIRGRKGLERSILENTELSPAGIVEQYRQRYLSLTQTGRQRDDITAILVEVLTHSRRNQIKEDLGFEKGAPVYLQFFSYYEEMDKVSGAILRDMDEAGYCDEYIRKMKITLTEIMANAISHGNKEDHKRKVTVGHLVEKASTTVAVMDEGNGFDPDSVPDPTLPENLVRDSGRGLFIVRNFVDEMHFSRKGNRVLIRKHRFGRKDKGAG